MRRSFKLLIVMWLLFPIWIWVDYVFYSTMVFPDFEERITAVGFSEPIQLESSGSSLLQGLILQATVELGLFTIGIIAGDLFGRYEKA